MPFHEQGELRYFTLSTFDRQGVKHGFFTRKGGISPQPWDSLNVATSVGDSRENVIENRNRIMALFGKRYDSIFDTWQIHSDIVYYSETPRPILEPHQKGDAVMTSNPDVALMMVFADCVPLLFYDTQKKIIAVAHAGWQGTVQHIASKTIHKMKEVYGSQTSNIITGIGPSIGADHYEIGEDIIKQVANSFSFDGNEDKVLIKRDDKIYFDMWQANKLLLEKEHVASIEIAGLCTACDTSNWYSHRAENGTTGRFAAVLTVEHE